ncbi:MAG: ribulose bisphosphate carboxylase small subunit, partial [Candidatus Eremiobacteraeota bacterium]|nr:ribulose bisphosphate carboxylase small subunit [Candidatus Eremiobacteraeota bacterium]
PMFDVKDAAGIMDTVRQAVREHPNDYVKVNAYDARLGRQTTALSFIVGRPKNEKGFRLERQGAADRQIRYTLHSYATDKPQGERYSDDD